ncbi:hypothetical protein [Qipengyuania sp.]|uniref:hypothetical protein n=1 Tax=Qipengyuania sp. TaxID=2004515 RepID=UPI003512A9FC
MVGKKRFPSFYFRDRHQFAEYLDASSDDDVAATIYTSQIGRVFTALALVEDTFVSALWMCENVKLDGKKKQLPRVREFDKRKGILKDQTFGNLISVLKSNGVSKEAISYFEFVKRMRDRFVHRFFDDNLWPGDLPAEGLLEHSRTLAVYEIIFNRANHRIWKVLGSEIFYEVVDLGDDGLLIMNDLSDVFEDGEQLSE